MDPQNIRMDPQNIRIPEIPEIQKKHEKTRKSAIRALHGRYTQDSIRAIPDVSMYGYYYVFLHAGSLGAHHSSHLPSTEKIAVLS